MKTIEWKNGKVRILDQVRLPNELVLLEISDHHGIVKAIKEMNVRGAPAIGIAAAFGVVLGIWNASDTDRALFLEKSNKAIDDLKATRPTAKDLFWALDRMRKKLSANLNRPVNEIKIELLKEAQNILENNITNCKRIGRNGAALLPANANILTHCNAGALAMGGYGSALGIVRAAVEQSKKVKVYSCETRPLLQGARITCFELMEDDINVTLICDSAAAYVMSQNLVNAVIVGADRIAANGDFANKIGTYGLAVLAKQHHIPFFVAAPLSSIDFDIKTGKEIVIEKRAPEEITKIGDMEIAPEGVPVLNPAFDVTPHQFISALITEKGVIRPPLFEGLSKQKNKS
ncbi:S-methyl-5-thioribose-1-phosphate isomerase [candidate division KSB1 bacterium]|nr:S-methyl-5-thioribose-1-phosphate isomerase [candidate division KSB1 bacterium]